MKDKVLCLFILLVISKRLFIYLTVFLAASAILQAQPTSDFTYFVNPGDPSTVTINSYTGSPGPVSIPTTISNLTVTGIAEYGGGPVFAYSGVTSIFVPEGITTIGTAAFSGDPALTNVSLPASVSSIADGAFVNLNLETISVDGANSNFSSVVGVLFDKSQATLLAYAGAPTASYAIPGTVKSIEAFAFESASVTNDVTMGGGVTNIGAQAFSGCGIKSMVIGDGVINIDGEAFYESALSSVVIGTNVTTIGNDAFGVTPLVILG